MQELGYYNGEFGPLSEMKVPMLDRGCYFGDGVYEATYCTNRTIFACDEHIDRFFNSAGLLKMKPDFTKPQLKQILYDMVEKVEGDKLLVYWQMTRGTAPRSPEFPKVHPNLWIMITQNHMRDMDSVLKLITREDTRFLHCNIKTLNLLPSVMTYEEAVQAGCDEVVLHRNGRVTECSHSNVHMIKDGILYTAPADQYILPGIARARMIRMCKRLEIPVSETAFTLEQMMAADEVLVTSSGALCAPASEIDGIPVGGKAPELVRQLQNALKEEYDREVGLL